MDLIYLLGWPFDDYGGGVSPPPPSPIPSTGSTLTFLQDQLRKLIGRPTVLEVPNSELTQVINWAYRDIASRYPHLVVRPRANFTTASGTPLYNLPSPFANTDVIHVVWDRTNRLKLERLGERRASIEDSEGSAALIRGRPMAYSHWADGLQLYPTPDGEYSIQVVGKKVVVDLVDGTDQIVLGPVWDMGILLYARWHYWEQKGDFPKSQYALSIFKVWMADKPLEVDEEKYDLDSGVELPGLSGTWGPRLDWDHEN